jgi:hypothetical protein
MNYLNLTEYPHCPLSMMMEENTDETFLSRENEKIEAQCKKLYDHIDIHSTSPSACEIITCSIACMYEFLKATKFSAPKNTRYYHHYLN